MGGFVIDTTIMRSRTVKDEAIVDVVDVASFEFKEGNPAFLQIT